MLLFCCPLKCDLLEFPQILILCCTVLRVYLFHVLVLSACSLTPHFIFRFVDANGPVYLIWTVDFDVFIVVF